MVDSHDMLKLGGHGVDSLDRHIDRVDEGAGRKKCRRQIGKGEEPGMRMERTLGVVGGKVLHSVAPRAGTVSVATGSGEWFGKRLGDRALTESQRADKGEDSKNGDTAGGPGGNVEVEPVNAGLLGRCAAVGRWRRVQLAGDGSATWEVQSRMVVLGDQGNNLSGDHRMGKGHWSSLAQAVAKASQEDGRARAAGGDNRLGEHNNPTLVNSQPLDGDRSVHQEGVFHMRGSARGEERGCPGSTRDGKLVCVGKTREISGNLASQVMHGKGGRRCRHDGGK
jgi:hypothetical protein